MCLITSFHVFWWFECFFCFCLRHATLLKKRLWYKGFLLNFAKFLRIPYLTEHLRWLLQSAFFSLEHLPKAFILLLLAYGKLKNEDFGITLNFLQFNKKFISRSYTLFYEQRRFQLSLSFCLTHYSPVLLFYTPWKHQKT